MPVGRLEIFFSFMEAAREQVGGSRWQRDSGVGVGREEELGAHWGERPRGPPKWPGERLEQVWAAWTRLLHPNSWQGCPWTPL